MEINILNRMFIIRPKSAERVLFILKRFAIDEP